MYVAVEHVPSAVQLRGGLHWFPLPLKQISLLRFFRLLHHRSNGWDWEFVFLLVYLL